MLEASFSRTQENDLSRGLKTRPVQLHNHANCKIGCPSGPEVTETWCLAYLGFRKEQTVIFWPAWSRSRQTCLRNSCMTKVQMHALLQTKEDAQMVSVTFHTESGLEQEITKEPISGLIQFKLPHLKFLTTKLFLTQNLQLNTCPWRSMHFKQSEQAIFFAITHQVDHIAMSEGENPRNIHSVQFLLSNRGIGSVLVVIIFMELFRSRNVLPLL